MRSMIGAAALVVGALSLGAASGQGAGLAIRGIPAFPREAAAEEFPGQLPGSRVARGTGDVALAWLAGPTDRYPHSVLGDRLEAARLVVTSRAGTRHHVELPVTRVFEDLEPRLVDLDGDGRDEILVVESDVSLGASLAVYGLDDGRVVRRAATPFLGRPNRWLNPLGVGDFDGDGRLDIALVVTPHIGGVLRLYRYTPPTLHHFAAYVDVSTHRMGSTELGLGRVVPARPRDRLLVPDQVHGALLLLEWTPAHWVRLARVALPDRLESSLFSAGAGRWRFRLADGRHFEVQLAP